MKKLIILVIFFATFFSFNTYVFAIPDSCTATGFCLVENQTCPGGSIKIDTSCSESPYRGEACCVQEDTPPTELESTEIDIFKGPDNAFLDSLNPLKMGGANTDIATQLSTPGGIVSRLLQFLFPIAGLILFLMLIWGGFEILVKSTQGTKGIEAGRNRITAAIVGFLLLFATYWIAQIIEVIFGIVIV